MRGGGCDGGWEKLRPSGAWTPENGPPPMSRDDGLRGPRRLLIATAVAHLPRSPVGSRPGLVQARQKIIDLFTTRLGYTHISDLGLDPDRNALLDQLERFATSEDRRPDDMVVVYLAGHGQLLGSTPRRHMFFPADSDLSKPKQALPTSQIASVLLDDTNIKQLLFVLDTCHAGQGREIPWRPRWRACAGVRTTTARVSHSSPQLSRLSPHWSMPCPICSPPLWTALPPLAKSLST